ncbi:hypothetical protein ABT382_33825 [Streptomyces pharetrae]
MLGAGIPYAQLHDDWLGLAVDRDPFVVAVGHRPVRAFPFDPL